MSTCVYAVISGVEVSNIVVMSAEGSAAIGTAVDITNLDPRPGIGWTYTNGVFSAPAVVVPTPEADLPTVKARAIDAVNTRAGNSRLKFMTSIPGQESTYQFKQQEMERYYAATDPQPADYPFLAAEAAATGQNLAELAALVKATWEQWQPLAVHIEATRRGAIVAIENAETVEEVLAVQPVFP